MKTLLKNIILLLILFILAACGGEKSTTEDVAATKPVRDTLIIAQSGEAKSLDPHKGNDGFSLRINKQIYSRLVEANGRMEIVPGLAESWKQVDPKTVEFKLREGVKFHNGEELKAEDVRFSFERMMNSPRISFVLPPIKEVEVVDDYTVRIVTTNSFGPLMAHLSHPALAVVNKRAVEKWGEDYGKHPVGTGPYKFSSWDAGDKITLERNDDYFLDRAHFKKLIFRSIVEESSRTIALETKEADIALGIGALDKETVVKNEDLTLLEKPSISYNYIGFNNDKELFKNKDLRLAINYAIDKEALIDVVLNGAGKVATSPIAPGVFGFTDKTESYGYDLKKAKEYMERSGVAPGTKIKLTIFEGNSNTQVAEIVQAQLREIGIEVEIESLEVGTFWQYTANGKHDMFLGSWGCVTGDADYGLYAMYHSSAKGAPGNRSFYGNPKVDELLDLGKETIDPAKRKGIYEEIQKLIVEDAPDVMLYNRVLGVGMQSDLTGLELHPVTLHDFYPVKVK